METKDLYITGSCKIQAGQIHWGNQQVLESEALVFSAFAKEAYQHLAMDYPKFFKMDALSKLAILGAEVLLKSDLSLGEDSDIALLFSNSSSSLDTDVKHQKSISNAEEFYPSPAVFVYTLANICMGEVSIRHGLKSENAFFVSPSYDVNLMWSYATYLLQNHLASQVVCGWVEYFQETYQLVLYLVDSQGSIPHNTIEIKNLFK